IRQSIDAIVKRAVPAGNGGLAAGHHLVPSPCARDWPVREQRKVRAAGKVGLLSTSGCRRELFGQKRRWIFGETRCRCFPDHASAFGAFEPQIREQVAAFHDFEADIESCVASGQALTPPSRKYGRPSLSRVILL